MAAWTSAVTSAPHPARPVDDGAGLADDARGLFAVCYGASPTPSSCAEGALAAAAHAITAGDGARVAFERAQRVVAARRGLDPEHDLDDHAALALLAAGADRATVAHVGDCAVYRVRGGVALRLAAPHTLAEDPRYAGVLRGEIAPQAARILTRALGAQSPDVRPEVREIELAPGDLFVLTSASLTGAVSLEALAGLARADAAAAAPALLAEARRGGLRGQLTIVVAARGAP